MDEACSMAVLAGRTEKAYRQACYKKKVNVTRKIYTPSCRKSVLLPKARKVHQVCQKSSKDSSFKKKGTHRLLEELQDHFPYVDLSQETLNLLHRRAQQEIIWAANQLAKLINDIPLAQVKCKDMLERQKKLSEILYKDVCTQLRLKNLREEQQIKQGTKGALHDMKIHKARCCRYIEHYHSWFLQRLQGQRKLGEAFVKNTFLDGCHNNRTRILEIQRKHKELQQAEAKALSQRLGALCTYYESQCESLVEKLAKDTAGYRVQIKEQKRAIEKIKRDFRHKLESAVQELQDNIIHADRQQWREADANRYLQ